MPGPLTEKNLAVVSSGPGPRAFPSSTPATGSATAPGRRSWERRSSSRRRRSRRRSHEHMRARRRGQQGRYWACSVKELGAKCPAQRCLCRPSVSRTARVLAECGRARVAPESSPLSPPEARTTASWCSKSPQAGRRPGGRPHPNLPSAMARQVRAAGGEEHPCAKTATWCPPSHPGHACRLLPFIMLILSC